jgi:hypothetical protein
VVAGGFKNESMKVAAIYNVWSDGLDLLSHSVNNILPVVDGVIIIWSDFSNQGQHIKFEYWNDDEKVRLYQCEPTLTGQVHFSETKKRNFGLDKARDLGFTHFIMMDSDEFYEQSAFTATWNDIKERDVAGVVCATRVYFKKPTLWVPDHTLVPFIHKITPSLQFNLNDKNYPFAYDDAGNAHIDPTRRLNIRTGVEWSNIVMHHYSWVRSDYNLKIENSAARNNLKRSSIYRDLENAAPGVYNEFYRAEIKQCENIFNLPEL